jgi:hypothetical protein
MRRSCRSCCELLLPWELCIIPGYGTLLWPQRAEIETVSLAIATRRAKPVTVAIKFGEQFYGYTVSLYEVAAVMASVNYAFYCRRVPFGWLSHASIVLGILSAITYWMLAGRVSAALIALAVGFTYVTTALIQLDLTAVVIWRFFALI